jgi:ornithine--oxo-acid transaminase
VTRTEPQDHVPTSPAPLAQDPQHWIDLEDRYAAHNYHPLDVVLSHADGCYVWDVRGRKFLDFLAAYSAVNQGHQHPRIVKALVEQAHQLALTSRAFRNDKFGPFCEKLAKLSGYQKVLMMNTGAEAVETAIKAARRWGYEKKGVPEDQAKVLVFERNFHGRTTTIVGFSSDDVARSHFGPFPPGFVRVPYGDLEAAKKAVDDTFVAVLVEPIQGEGGVIVPPDDFLPGLRALCDEKRALLICDEIQAGLGRAGALFSHTLWGVRADGVTIGKALSGGVYPVSAFLADDEVMDVFTAGSHGSTYGGNPLACAVAEAALDVLVDEKLIERSAELGDYLLAQLRAIDSPKIKEVRGKGLWIGFEFAPEAGGARRYSEMLEARGLLAKETQTHTLRFAPPLTISREDLDWAISQVREILKD